MSEHDGDHYGDLTHDDDHPHDNGRIIHGRVLTADPAQPAADAGVLRGTHLV